MAGVERLDAAETRAWRALVRIATIFPRHLNDELMDARRVSLVEKIPDGRLQRRPRPAQVRLRFSRTRMLRLIGDPSKP